MYRSCGICGDIPALVHRKNVFYVQLANAKGGRKGGKTIATEHQLGVWRKLWWKILSVQEKFLEWMLQIKKKLVHRKEK